MSVRGGVGLELALVSRDLEPFVGGGIAGYVTATATLLSGLGHTTIFTRGDHRSPGVASRGGRNPLLPPDVDVVFVEEPVGPAAAPFHHPLQAWSSAALDAVMDRYGGRGPDLLEFPDYLGEGAVAVQAKVTGDPRLATTAIAVRVHGSDEIIKVVSEHLPSDPDARFVFDLERYALRFADVLLVSSAPVLETYRRFYGAGRLAQARVVRHPFGPDIPPAPPRQDRGRGDTRLLFAGRLSAAKGAIELARAVTALGPEAAVDLTMLGEDTHSAPLGGSIRGYLTQILGGDSRVTMRGRLDRDEIPALLASHDALIAPSRWECWSNSLLEALAANRPVLAPPVGGFNATIEHGRSGWLSRGTSSDALGELIERLMLDPDQIAEPARHGWPRARFEELTDPEPIRASYMSLIEARPSSRPARADPLVSIIVPYFRLSRFVAETVESALAQTHRRLEVIVVNDGSFDEEDRLLAKLSARLPITVITEENAGLDRVRNLGVEQSRGKYFLIIDPDNVLEPAFVARAVAALEARPDVAYVTSWTTYVDADGVPIGPDPAGYRPLFNAGPTIDERNTAGDMVAVIRRSVFDRGYRFEHDSGLADWFFFQEIGRDGLVGHAIPEPLMRYRLRSDSNFNSRAEEYMEAVREPMAALRVERGMRWTD